VSDDLMTEHSKCLLCYTTKGNQ